jgi:hypothetical protein
MDLSPWSPNQAPELRPCGSVVEFNRLRGGAHGGIPPCLAAEPSAGAWLIRTRKPLPQEDCIMGLGKGLLLWLIGIPLPIIILLAIFWH